MFDPLPPLNALRSFVLVATHGSLASAAALQNITQPAISKRMKLLERHLGATLLIRGANAVTLTPAGRRYAEQVARAFAEIEAAAAGLNGETGPLRIRCFTTWATRWLIPRLPRFRAQHPECEIEIRTSVEPVDFARDDVSAAVWSAGEEPPAPSSGRLQAIRIAPFAGPELAGSFNGDWDQVTRLGSKNRPGDWTKWSEESRLKPGGPLLMFETTALAIEVALRGMGVVVASEFMVADEVAQGRLVRLGALVATGSRYWLNLPPNGPSRPETFLFRDWLVSEVRREDAEQPGA